MNVGLLLFSVFMISWAMTFALRCYALRKRLMDIPNERSSHSVPTPRGGGVAIVVSFLLALPVLFGLGLLPLDAMCAFLGAGLLTAGVGFADDHGHIAARWRLLGHFIAGAWALFWLGGLPLIEIFGMPLNLGWIGSVLALLYLVWMLNLYNFMDGIDGLAGCEALSVCLSMCIVYWACGSGELAFAPLVLASAATGFLLWNLPPARIFMGDAGSGFLGMVLGVLVIKDAWAQPDLLWCWLILLGGFIVDSTWTLARRLLHAQKVYQAHRSHAYQHASRVFKSHKVVTVAFVALNIFWLLPLALLVARGSFNGTFGLLVAYAPLVLLCVKFKAGVNES